MRAACFDRYGDTSVLEVREFPDPVPGPGEVLVRVHAAALNPKDVLIRKGKLRIVSGLGFPKRVGYDWAGEVIAHGPGVSAPAIGARVFGMINAWRAGACAELLAARVDELAETPDSLDWEHAAAVPLAALTALQALRDVAGLKPGQAVTIHGASGGVGVFATPIAKALGAHVTTTSSASNRALCESLGADVALDYRADPVVDPARRCDVFFDVFGNQRWSAVRPMLARTGTYVSTVPKPHVFTGWARTLFASQRCRLVVVRSRATDLRMLASWIADGTLRPTLDTTFSLEQIREAQARIETRRARGKVVLTVGA